METFYSTHVNGQIEYKFTPKQDDARQSLCITAPEGTVQIIERQKYWETYDYKQGRYRIARREQYEAPRVYVGVDNEESILENLANRKRRPYTIFKHMSSALFDFIGVDITKQELSWRQNAGCTMCPCSPGFVLSKDKQLSITLPDNTVVSFEYFDVYVKLNNAPSVDETKEARLIEVLV